MAKSCEMRSPILHTKLRTQLLSQLDLAFFVTVDDKRRMQRNSLHLQRYIHTLQLIHALDRSCLFQVHLQVFDGMCHVFTVFMFTKSVRFVFLTAYSMINVSFRT